METLKLGFCKIVTEAESIQSSRSKIFSSYQNDSGNNHKRLDKEKIISQSNPNKSNLSTYQRSNLNQHEIYHPMLDITTDHSCVKFSAPASEFEPQFTKNTDTLNSNKENKTILAQTLQKIFDRKFLRYSAFFMQK